MFRRVLKPYQITSLEHIQRNNLTTIINNLITMDGKQMLFMHGLESGPGGSKHRWFINHFKQHNMQVVCPDMDVSMWRPDKRNSIVRQIISNLLFGWPSTLLSRAMISSLQGCLEIQVPTLQNTRTTLVVASSYGGAVATLALANGTWNGPTILLAPAYGKAAASCTDNHAPEEIYKTIKEKLTQQQRDRIFVVHGTQDDVVPFADSEKLAKMAGIELIPIQGGDHRLNHHILKSEGDTQPLLAKLVDRIMR
eukprot:m.55355 g.55355  ORF g.55355 m.55355 type:complete len:252 (-) comp10980_c0_seq1:1969-2724(-)